MFSLLLKDKCKEWICSPAFAFEIRLAQAQQAEWTNETELERVYKDIHNKQKDVVMKAIYQYLHHRMGTMFTTYETRLDVMMWRHSIYKVLFEFYNVPG